MLDTPTPETKTILMAMPLGGSYVHKRPRLSALIELVGSVNAGILAWRIIHWSKGGTVGFERDGHLWVSLPTANWCFDTGLKPAQLRLAFEQLEKGGYIVRKHLPLEHRTLVRITAP